VSTHWRSFEHIGWVLFPSFHTRSTHTLACCFGSCNTLLLNSILIFYNNMPASCQWRAPPLPTPNTPYLWFMQQRVRTCACVCLVSGLSMPTQQTTICTRVHTAL
jgi:hypothetical protein